MLLHRQHRCFNKLVLLMRNVFLIFICLFSFISCQEKMINKPDNLIKEEQMVNIIYDLAILEAARTQPTLKEGAAVNINPTEFVYKKYKVDSVQFAKSDQFYATDFEVYKRIYDNVNKRIQSKIDTKKGDINPKAIVK